MNQNRPILTLQQPCDAAVSYFVERMNDSGLNVMRTFDFHDTRVDESVCTCQNHGTEKCDCQMIVLLVYGRDNQPATLVAHGHNGQTWFSLVECIGFTNTRLEAQICDIFTPAEVDPAVGDVS